MRKLMTVAVMLMMLAVVAPIGADAKPLPGDGPESGHYDWQDCIWGDAPASAIIHSVRAKDHNAYSLDCQNVKHIKQGHGFNGETIPCIDRVLTTYDHKGPSDTDPRNDRFTIRNRPIKNPVTAQLPAYFFDAVVVTERHSHRIVTAWVEPKALDKFPPYHGDEWEACVSVGRTA